MHRKIVIEGAFSGHFAKLLDGLHFAPATDKWKWMDSRRVTVISDRYSMNKDSIHAYPLP